MDNNYPIKYNTDYLVVQANEIVRSKQDDISILEAKLIRLAIAQVVEDDTDLRTYKVNANELAKHLEIPAQNVYRDLQSITETLMRRVIRINQPDLKKNGKPNYKIIHWVDTAEYIDGNFTFKLSEELKPYIMGLYELFTAYSISEIMKLPTTNTLRLYELLMSFIKIKELKRPKASYITRRLKANEISFSIDWLKEYFNCADKYKQNGDFIRRVIEPSVNGIIENTNLPIGYYPVKEGRSIKHIVFQYLSYDSETGLRQMRRVIEEAKKEYRDKDE